MSEPHLEQAFQRWCALFAERGRLATLLDLYELAEAELGRPAVPRERSALWRMAVAVQFPDFDIVPGTDRAPEAIEVVDYDPAWPAAYESWRERLAAALGPAALRIDHVGSTAVPGLVAKPVIDVQVSVADLDDESSYVPAIESIGVQLRSRDRWHRFFRPFADRPRDVQVHVCPIGSQWESDHLAFRDRLRGDAEARRRYAEVKRRAAAEWPDDRMAYTDAKTAVILEILSS